MRGGRHRSVPDFLRLGGGQHPSDVLALGHVPVRDRRGRGSADGAGGDRTQPDRARVERAVRGGAEESRPTVCVSRGLERARPGVVRRP